MRATQIQPKVSLVGNTFMVWDLAFTFAAIRSPNKRAPRARRDGVLNRTDAEEAIRRLADPKDKPVDYRRARRKLGLA